MTSIDAKKYKRVLLKVSGEALMGDLKFGHDSNIIEKITKDIKSVINMGVEVCIVVGGGNIFRGVAASVAGMERANADYIGMLATIINALALQNFLEKADIETRVVSAIPMMTLCETYTRRKALKHMQKHRLVIFAAGMGSPFFTTDTAAVLRAIEMNCDAIFKATQVDGVYNKDPIKYKDAIKFKDISYKEVLSKELSIMDFSAITLAKDNNMPIVVFSIKKENEFYNVINNKGNYTIIKGENNDNNR